MAEFLPIFFVLTMGLALLLYVILDGFDLGVGLLLPLATDAEKDTMIASIGPFWDANETWIVLGIGILLIAFPKAHGLILTALYLPVTVMLFGLILRGVAFDFRVKAAHAHKQLWNRAFFVGSLLASTSQGWMLGAYITGLEFNLTSRIFAALIALTLPALYIMLGAGWLLIKTEDELFQKAIRWARNALPVMGLALLLVSIATPIVSDEIAGRWFTLPNAIGLMPIPVSCLVSYLILHSVLRRPEFLSSGNSWIVYATLILICLMAALGLAYSIFPYIIIGKMDLFEAAAATKSLQFIFYGVALTLPVILVYSASVFWVFRGKSTALSYE